MKTTIKKGACLARLQETCAVIGLCFRNFGEFLTLKSEKGGWALWHLRKEAGLYGKTKSTPDY